MSSSRWPRKRRAPALLSSDPSTNPLWHASNHVLLPYCSSDMWAGTRIHRNSTFAFAGRLIVRSVLTELLHLGLSTRLLLVGSSAGGTGVMLHADSARRLLRAHGVKVAAIADSGWFLDRPAKTKRSTETVARLGHSLWRGSPATSCVRQHITKPWLCYFGYRLYPHIRTPLFVFQYLFDTAQLTAEGVRSPRTRAQWDAVHETGAALRASLKMVRATFAPACLAHGALARPEWLAINVSGQFLNFDILVLFSFSLLVQLNENSICSRRCFLTSSDFLLGATPRQRWQTHQGWLRSTASCRALLLAAMQWLLPKTT